MKLRLHPVQGYLKQGHPDLGPPDWGYPGTGVLRPGIPRLGVLRLGAPRLVSMSLNSTIFLVFILQSYNSHDFKPSKDFLFKTQKAHAHGLKPRQLDRFNSGTFGSVV